MEVRCASCVPLLISVLTYFYRCSARSSSLGSAFMLPTCSLALRVGLPSTRPRSIALTVINLLAAGIYLQLLWADNITLWRTEVKAKTDNPIWDPFILDLAQVNYNWDMYAIRPLYHNRCSMQRIVRLGCCAGTG